jgi:hypothetical protein
VYPLLDGAVGIGVYSLKSKIFNLYSLIITASEVSSFKFLCCSSDLHLGLGG